MLDRISYLHDLELDYLCQHVQFSANYKFAGCKLLMIKHCEYSYICICPSQIIK
jgi:hypothetical protein